MSAAEQGRTYHWILTGQTGSGRTVTCTATFDAPPGTTRSAVFDEARAYVDQQAGSPVTVLFFALELDQL